MIIRFNFVSDAALFSSSYAAYLDTCERAGVPLLLVYEGLPEHARSEVLDTARRRGVRVLHIGGDEFPKLPDDPHFDRVGNQRVAEHLLDDVLALLDERR